MVRSFFRVSEGSFFSVSQSWKGIALNGINGAENGYRITEDTFTDYDDTISQYIEIVYPQLKGLESEAIEQIVNEEVRRTAFEVLRWFSSFDNMEIEVSNTITYASADVFSVHFVTKSFHSVQAYH